MPTFVYTVKDTAPHFAACMQAAGAHCSESFLPACRYLVLNRWRLFLGAGMTFALNPTTAMTYAQFNRNAMAS